MYTYIIFIAGKQPNQLPAVVKCQTRRKAAKNDVKQPKDKRERERKRVRERERERERERVI